MVKISIIIPVYNVEQYLKDCLDSVLNQDFSDMEIICVEGDSMDNSLSILREYAMQDERIHILAQKRGKGLSDARNIGLNHAKGKYVWFVDSDDMIAAGSCTELYEIAENYNTDILCFNMSILNEVTSKMKRYEEKNIDHKGVMSGRELFCQFQAEEVRKVGVGRKFIRRDFLIENDLLFCEGILSEDVLFTFECLMMAQRVMDINKNYYIYRRRDGSLVHERSARATNSVFVVLSRIYVYWHTHQFSMEENKEIRNYFIHYVRELRYRLVSNEDNESTLGNYPEQILYKLLCEGLDSQVMLCEEHVIELKKAKFIILYGAGWTAVDVLDYLQKKEIKVDVIAVSTLKDNPNSICGIKVRCIDELTMYTESPVIVGVLPRCEDEIIETLKCKGFETIITIQHCSKPASGKKSGKDD